MRIHLGPGKNWFGPYQLAEFLCFWAKKEVDEYGFKTKPKWVHKFGEFLAYGDIESEPEVGEKRDFLEERKQTILYKFLSWVHSKKKVIRKVQIDPWDTWSMDYTLAQVILPMLKQLASKKHGAPYVDDEDVPEELRSTAAPAKENEWDTDDNHFKRWDWILDEMIFAFEHIVHTSWKYDKDNTGKTYSVKREDGNYQILFERTEEEKVAYKEHQEKVREIEARISNGTRLFGKYYRGLWD